MRWAYVVRYAADLGIDTDERSEMLQATLADAETHHRFFVTLTGPDWRGSDLTSENTDWRVVLVDPDGAQTVPVEIEKIARPDRSLRRYFPTVGPLRLAFRIAFPAERRDGSPAIPRDANAVVLRFTGALGRVDLTWDLETVREP